MFKGLISCLKWDLKMLFEVDSIFQGILKMLQVPITLIANE